MSVSGDINACNEICHDAFYDTDFVLKFGIAKLGYLWCSPDATTNPIQSYNLGKLRDIPT